MRREPLEVDHLAAGARERGEKAALAAAGRAVHDDEFELRRQRRQLADDPPSIGAIAAGQRLGLPADLAQDVRHGARALAAAPAIDERAPALLLAGEQRLDMAGNVPGDQCAADLLRLERRHLLI